MTVIVLKDLTGSVTLCPESRKMRMIRNILGSLALGALIVYTMRLPDHPKAQPTVSPVAVIPIPTAPAPVVIAAPAIAANLPLPSSPAKRTHIIDNCFGAEPDLNIPVIWGPNAVIIAALKQDWEIVRKLIDAGAPVESTNEKGMTALMVAAQQLRRASNKLRNAGPVTGGVRLPLRSGCQGRGRRSSEGLHAASDQAQRRVFPSLLIR